MENVMATETSTQLTLKVVEAQAKDVGRAIARIDPKDMEHLGLDEKVTLSKVSAKPAEKLVLAPITLMHSARRGGDQYLGKLLEGMTLITGDRIRASLFGTQNFEFTVVSTSPKDGPVVITASTTIQLQSTQ